MFVEPWHIGDFRPALDHLKADGYYLFQGEIIKPSLGKRRQPSPEWELTITNGLRARCHPAQKATVFLGL